MARRLEERELFHDMRQPLAAIAALVGSAEVQDDLPSEVRTCLAQIKGQVDNLRNLCRTALDGSAPCQLILLDELVTAVVGEAELAHGRAIESVTTTARVVGDEASLRRAVWNLLENACRAAGSGRVRVSVAQARGEVRVEVSDGGPGFRNGPPGTSSLGLAIVDSVVRRHYGRVELSTGNLAGATVTIVMPAPEAGAGPYPQRQMPTRQREAPLATGE